MNKRRLGNSDLYITPIGFGAWAIGGSGWHFSLGDQDDRGCIAAIREAMDSGINWIDTAAVYGLGHSEKVVARALKGMSNRPYIFTKCSMTWNEKDEIIHCLKANSIRRECEASLRRLNVETIDLYQIHWANPDKDIEEAWSTLVALQNEGKVRHIGVANFNVAQIKRAKAIAPITSVQSGYSLIQRNIEADVLPFVVREKIGVLAYSTMASGLLTGAMTPNRIATLPDDDWRKWHSNFQEPRLSYNLRLVSLLRGIANQHGCTPAQVAVAWVLHNPAISGAVVGASRPGQIRGIVGAADLNLTAREISQIDAFFMKAAA